MRKEIDIRDIKGIRIGQAENAEAGTGVTVVIAPAGAPAGLDVRGGGPASRESELLKPEAAAEFIHAVVIGGGSAFGLDAAGGVMKYLEERGIGFDTGFARVPLVCQSDIYDLGVGDAYTRPDREMGYRACVNAETENADGTRGNYRDGSFGAGAGATVGKLRGIETCMKSGIGSYAMRVGDLEIGAIVCVNALGDVYDSETGEKIAGMRSPDGKNFRDTLGEMETSYEKTGSINAGVHDGTAGNTTIGIVITNAAFPKAKLCKIARVAHNGLARSIRPIHTIYDGDSVYALSVGNVAAEEDLVATLASEAVSRAITRAVTSAEGAYGYPSASDLAK